MYEDGALIDVIRQTTGVEQSAGGAGGEATNQTASEMQHPSPEEKVQCLLMSIDSPFPFLTSML